MAQDADGYGTITVKGRKVKAPKVAWMLIHGPVPAGLCVCHKCDNRICVRPDHLFLGTVADNNRDCRVKGRTCRGELNTKAILTEEAVRYIRANYRGIRNRMELAAMFGVKEQQVWKVAKRVAWKHI